ncbi:MAG: hypothetical protein O2967_15205 [Proteobacteria bacterium]|nr:hypothetical protein [Pseudomonadota bacterium]
MPYFIAENWNVLFGLIAGLWGVVQFLAARSRDLAWKRTEFIIEQSRYLDTDTEMRECTLILYGKHPTIRVDDFLRTWEQSQDEANDGQIILKFEKYLNFLWRIAYAHLVLKTIPRIDLVAFGAYFLAVNEHPKLKEYCIGPYDEIVMAANVLENAKPRSLWARLKFK